LRSDLDLMRLEAETEARELVHRARQQAARLTEAARHETEAMRLRAAEYLGAARQERAKTAAVLGDLSERLHTVAGRLASQDEDLPRRLVVLTNESVEEITQAGTAQIEAAPPA
jgi:hypothetical protein